MPTTKLKMILRKYNEIQENIKMYFKDIRKQCTIRMRSSTEIAQKF